MRERFGYGNVRIDVSLCETLSVTQSCGIAHSSFFIRSVTGGRGVGGGGRIVDLVEIGGFLLVYWTRGKW